MRLKTPGASPGRVGKCPRCGSLLKVPEVEPERPPAPSIRQDQATFVDRRVNKPTRRPTGPVVQGGLIACPKTLETSWRESLLYPLRGDSGVAILAFMPVGFWFATVPLFGLVPTFVDGTGLSLFALIFLFPVLILLIVILGQMLGFLGKVLVSSALGEIPPPRAPGWGLSEVGSTLARWIGALILGVVIGGAPTLIYWINCGEVDWLDRIVILDLVIPGLAYAQMALLATLLHETPWAGNPITVFQGIWGVGWSYAKPCLRSGTMLILVWILFEIVMRIKDPLGQAVAYWLFCFVVVYASIVVMRWLGLFCHRHQVILEWFPERIHSAGPAED